MSTQSSDIDPIETQEWLDALDSVVSHEGTERALFILSELQNKAKGLGLQSSYGQSLSTPYMNTIPATSELEYPGNLELEAKLESWVRWNAAVTVAAANKADSSLGGHIGTFASSCTLYEVGFNHFFKAPSKDKAGDLLLIQGHASPGIYSRSFLEGRITDKQLVNFRKEVDGEGVSSYPHPWLMPNYWQFPTVSMGLGPMMAIYQARFMKYLQHRGLAETKGRYVWAFCGDGEMDEPESMGAITRAGREKLDNLNFVINCNLQRLDGLVNGNGKIIQELESSFRGAGWNVIKVIWGSDWEVLIAKDKTGKLQQRLESACDGDFQTFQARGGAYMREHLFGGDADLEALVADMSDEQLHKLSRGGHDAKKVYAAYKAAVDHEGAPSVILVKTIKGFGMGEAGESRNVAHNQKKLKVDELQVLRDNFNIDVSDKDMENYKRVMPNKDAPEMKYLHERRDALNGYLPARFTTDADYTVPHYEDFAKRLLAGTGDERTMSTTTAYVQILTALCKDKSLGKYVVPVTPDESRTFGMEGLFRQLGIYNAEGQKYEPEDRQQVMYYKEAEDGQILQEGINEGGAFASWLAAATSYSVHNVPMIPFYIYYSMFGFQRIGDFAWLAGDMRARGFLLGATAGRTTLNGEGLQHEDGHSHIQAGLIPNCVTYDPTYAYELAVIVWHGLQRMVANNEDVFFYITMMNESYVQPAMPKGVEDGIIKGLYLLKDGKGKGEKHVQLMGSGTILNEVVAAAELLQKDFGVSSDVWSMTSANNLYRDGIEVSRYNRLHPEDKAKTAYITEQLGKHQGPVVAATDYIRLYTEQLRDFVPHHYVTLGTDGFGRSDNRENLRRHFEVDRYHVVVAALRALQDEGVVSAKEVAKAIKQYNIDTNRAHPLDL